MFAYNNNYYSSIGIDLLEALYGRRDKSPIGWFDVYEMMLFGLYFIHQAIEKVKVIQDKLKATQSWKVPYADVRRRELDFDAGN